MTSRRSARGVCRVRGALLLEVVVALAVLVTAMGLLGAQLCGGLNMTTYAEEQLRAALLADRIVAMVQLDPEIQRRISEAEDVEDKFGDEYPGYFWHVRNEPLDRENQEELRLITVQVYYQPDPSLQDDVSGISSARLMRQLGFFKAKPGTLDLVSEGGLTEEQAEQLRQAIPIAGFDPSNVDLQQLMTLLDPDMISQLLPMLLPLLQQISAGGMPSELAELAEQFGGGALNADQLGGASPDELANAIREAVETGRAGGGSGIPPPPPRGGRAPGRMPGQGAPGGQGPGQRMGAPPGQRPPGQRPAARPGPPPSGVNVGQGSGPNGEYTIEDLMRMRDEYERSQGGRR